jgi:peptidyl-tRNA hydrolase
MAEKLYVVVRADLAPADQAVQGCHAARQFSAEHPESERAWFQRSNHLALLCVPDEAALRGLVERARWDDVRVSVFHEPDMGNALTAAAFEPGARGHRVCGRLPLALSPP